jgi:hypothetical protein
LDVDAECCSTNSFPRRLARLDEPSRQLLNKL